MAVLQVSVSTLIAIYTYLCLCLVFVLVAFLLRFDWLVVQLGNGWCQVNLCFSIRTEATVIDRTRFGTTWNRDVRNGWEY